MLVLVRRRARLRLSIIPFYPLYLLDFATWQPAADNTGWRSQFSGKSPVVRAFEAAPTTLAFP
jgi:hypothetical protein